MAAGRANIRRGRFGSARSLHGGAVSCACLAGKEGERRRAGEGEPAPSPSVAIFSQAI